MSSSFPYLVADIGGTNARFSLVTGCDDAGYRFENTRNLSTQAYPTFEACLKEYLDRVPAPRPKHACVAVAAPVTGDYVRFTNVDWAFSIDEVRQALDLEVLELMNDFAALAYSVTHLQSEDLVEIVPGQALERSACAIIGPGTGLGVAGLVPVENGWLPIPGEAGHVAFAAVTPREHALVMARQQLGYVCVQDFISGKGLVNLYNTLAEIDGQSERVEEASEVTIKAFEQNEPLAVEAMNLFCEGLGTAVGDAALTYIAKGGVYLGGGILPRMIEFFRNSGFEQRMKAKGVQEGFMQNIPVSLIVHDNPALIGAAAWLER